MSRAPPNRIPLPKPVNKIICTSRSASCCASRVAGAEPLNGPAAASGAATSGNFPGGCLLPRH